MTHVEIMKILENHAKWLNKEGGERANLSGADLRSADLRKADLRGVNLRVANLRDADLTGADISYADLRSANLRNADLYGADLRCADLRCADLYGADLRKADLDGADLTGADLCCANLMHANMYNTNLSRANLSQANLRGAKNITNIKHNACTAFLHLQCPENGQYTGYKRLRDDLIAELIIPEHAKRSSATTRKCRASEAIVVSITDLSGEVNYKIGRSIHNNTFKYVVGEKVVVHDFCEDRWNECAAGIHHFITRSEAVDYSF